MVKIDVALVWISLQVIDVYEELATHKTMNADQVPSSILRILGFMLSKQNILRMTHIPLYLSWGYVVSDLVLIKLNMIFFTHL